jgi:gliding motility-associated-like protein
MPSELFWPQKIAAGTYYLYVIDSNGCRSLYNTYTVSEPGPIEIVPGTGKILSDQCEQGVGGVGGIQITGGVPPYICVWTDANGVIVSNSRALSDVHQGIYTITVQDSTHCGFATAQFTVTNYLALVDPPVVPAVHICSAGQAVIVVRNPLSGYGYRLYSSAISTDTLAVDGRGLFTVNVSQAATFYVTQYIGDCESARVAVDISIVLSGLVVPNTFTPNADGINDYWTIKGISDFPDVVVQIFTRYGQKVFESKGYSQPFDGTYSNAKLPPGVYYYIINLNANCSLIAGSLTLIR